MIVATHSMFPFESDTRACKARCGRIATWLLWFTCTGTLPKELGHLTALMYLKLSCNGLTGEAGVVGT